MPRARLSIDVPEGTWIHAISTAHPDAVFEVVTALAGEDAGVALLEVTTAAPIDVITEVDAREDVDALDLLWKREETALLQVSATGPPLLLPLWEAGVPVRMPFTVRDGAATWDLTTSADRLSSFGDHLDAAGIQYTVEYVQHVEESAADRLLTDRQQQVLLAAVERGYYATPREATLTDVADHLGVSKATASDVLHRAEGAIVDWFVDEHLAATGAA